MSSKQVTVAIAAILVLAGTTWAKGPQNTSKSAAFGGYSGKGVPAASSASKYASKASRFPTQPAVTSKYSATARYRASTANLNANAANATNKRRKYSTQRPSASPFPTTASTFGSKNSDGRVNPVRFPSRPARAPATASRSPFPATPGKSKLAAPTFQNPPIVIYPKAERRPQPTTPLQPAVQATTSRPTISTSQKKAYYPGLRPSYPAVSGNRYPSTTIGVNRPVVINNQSTNITNINQVNNITNTTNNVRGSSNNIDRWFQSGRWQNQITINSHNWNGRPWWYTPDYGDWHHGHWHGQYYYRGGDSWSHVNSGENQWLSGLVSWGLGNLVYRSGYQYYSNPYYVRPLNLGSTNIDYSRPICVQQSAYETAYANDQAKADRLRGEALAYFNRARQEFFEGNASQAYNDVNRAIALMPDDASMHEFRALTLFSVGRYDEAAEVMHAVLAVAPGWDWTTLSGLYREQDSYVRQLRALEQYVGANPRRADARFLLAYHYITMGHADDAAEELRSVLILNPEDRLSTDLLSLLRQDKSQADDLIVPGSGTVRLADLRGDWKALRPEGEVKLEIDDDGFKWDYDLVGNDQILRGKYKLTNNLLLLATPEGAQMVGSVDMRDRDHFNFRLMGSNSNDPGLAFVRR